VALAFSKEYHYIYRSAIIDYYFSSVIIGLSEISGKIMSLFDGFRKWLNPTSAWYPCFDELVVDLDRHALNSAQAGDDLEKFSFLGRGKIRRDYSISVDYPELGLTLHTGAHKICDSFLIAFPKLEYPIGFTAFSGKFKIGENLLAADAIDCSSKVMNLLGEPYCRHKDDEELIFFYEFSSLYEWQFEFSLNGKTRALIVTSSPLLEDEEQRLYYNCKHPWPPPRK
jgi:hypothetical protein